MSSHHSEMTHLVSYAPAMFFVGFLVGLVIHMYIPFGFVPENWGLGVGAIFLFLGPLLVLKAQQKRNQLYHPTEYKKFDFYTGAYKFTRHPTYLGLTFLLIGFSFLTNSLPMLVVAVVLFFVFSFIIVPREEKLLEKVAGKTYVNYKKKVRMWF